MAEKKFILNADDFGMSLAFNRAVLEGYSEGLLKSTSLAANGEPSAIYTGTDSPVIEDVSTVVVPLLTMLSRK